MPGEFNGTKALLKKNGSTIVGQMEMTMTANGTPIDISNKSFDDFVTLLNGELAGKQIVFAGTIIHNTDVTYKAMIADSWTGTQDTYTMTYPDGSAISSLFVPSGLSQPVPHGDKVSTSITISSSGEYTITPPT